MKKIVEDAEAEQPKEIQGFADAIDAGSTKSGECTFIITEEESASLIVRDFA